MDVLERVAESGRDLLDRVDRVLAARGAPAVDPIWSLLRRVGALPGETLRFALSLDAESLHATSIELRERSRDFATRRAALAAHIATETWEGAGADAFAALWTALSAHVGDATSVDQPSIAGRLLAMASYVDAVVEWIDHTRGDLAMTIADALRCAEAVTLRTDPTGPAAAHAASAIGVRVLSTVSDSLRAGRDLHEEWSRRLTDLSFDAPAEPPPPAGTTRVHL